MVWIDILNMMILLIVAQVRWGGDLWILVVTCVLFRGV
jgi:hypothetical protein